MTQHDLFGLTCLMLLIFVNFIGISCEVFWEIRTHPVIFEEDVVLFCNITLSAPCSICYIKWYGGQNLKLLTVDNITINDSKYLPEEEQDGYTLRIKNLNARDVGWNYSCTHNFETDMKRLDIQEGFELRPTNNTLTVSKTFNGQGDLQILVNFAKVHPLPRCTIYFNKYNVSNGLNKTVTPEGLFYAVAYEVNLNVEEIICQADIQMNCSVGSMTHVLINENVTRNCQENWFVERNMTRHNNNYDDEQLLFNISVGIPVALMLVIFILVYWYKPRERQGWKRLQHFIPINI